MEFNKLIDETMECPFCEGGMSKANIEKENVTFKDKWYSWIVYKCDKCKEGFTTTESDDISYRSIKRIADNFDNEFIQPEEFPGITPLPWFLMDTGLKKNGPDSPTIYATNDDLEIVVKVPRDTILVHSVQDNLANAKYIVEACNQYPKLLKEVQRLRELLNIKPE